MAQAQPVSVPRAARRQWRWIAVAGAALLVAAAVALVFVLVTGGSSGPSHGDFVSSANALLVPVVDGDGHLASALAGARAPGDLAGMQAAAARQEAVVSRAQVAASLLRAPAKDEPARLLLQHALRDDLAAAQRLGDAAVALTPARASAAAAAAEAARRSWVALSAADGSLTAPSPTAVANLKTLAGQAAPTDRQWVSAVDALLAGSAGLDGATAKLIDDVERDQGHDPAAANRRIDGIIARRRALQSRIAALTPPARFRPAAALLRASVATSLADAIATKSFIGAWYLSDATNYNHHFGEHFDAMHRAAGQESAFLQAYNALRTVVLGLKPLEVRGY